MSRQDQLVQKKLIHVAAGIVSNACNEVLIAKRPSNKHLAGYWEFPGGKVEALETADHALIREFKEEIGINITQYKPFLQVNHDYPDKSVLLDFFYVTGFTGKAEGLEGQDIRWVLPSQLTRYDFPDGNLKVVNELLNLG